MKEPTAVPEWRSGTGTMAPYNSRQVNDAMNVTTLRLASQGEVYLDLVQY